MRYRDLFARRPEFFRSVRIDVDDPQDRSFHVTPMFVDVLGRIVEGITTPSARAITVTGPYGMGKSATLLQIALLLETRDASLLRQLAVVNPNLADRVVAAGRRNTLRVTGSQAPLSTQLGEAIVRWNRMRGRRVRHQRFSGTEPLEALVLSVVKLAHDEPNGLIIMWDELGKNLEYASRHPAEGDIYLLQLLAEAAARSSSAHPLLFIGVLHQGFESYGQALLRSQRQEFAKVQGRFEDIAFSLPLVETLRLTGQAITATRQPGGDFSALEAATCDVVMAMFGDSAATPGGLPITVLADICAQAAPLHPLVTLLLGPLFRELAQNQRSLFGFLGSTEPFGFQAFLDDANSSTAPALYTLADLYDYVVHSLGGGLYHGLAARRWIQIESALQRVSDHLDQVQLVKVIGLLGVVGNVHGIMPTSRILRRSLPQADDVLSALERQSVIVYRHFSDSYRLWDGSDINIEELLNDARQAMGWVPLSEALTVVTPPKAVVARRHSIRTGALRWFEVAYVDGRFLKACSGDDRPQIADGRVYLVLAEEGTPPPDEVPLTAWWQIGCWVPVPPAIAEAAMELRYLDWVEAHVPGLQGDDAARNELAIRRHLREQLIESIVDRLVWDSPDEIAVWRGGRAREWVRGTELNAYLSNVCDSLYHRSPWINSEFVNRHELSSAATAARNDVLRRMLECADQPDLGIDGYPPQVPIYRATLMETGLHGFDGDVWRLTEPGPDSAWHEAWHSMGALIQDQYRTVDEVWKVLMDPPFGLRKGLLPILTVAFIVVHRNRVSLLEEGSFVPQATMPLIERMLHHPERVSLRLTSLTGVRADILGALARRQLVPAAHADRDLLGLVRPLVIFAQRLPEYTRTTQRLSPRSQAVRQELLSAREPLKLLFEDLPHAVGIPLDHAARGQNSADLLADALQSALEELANAYPALLARLERAIVSAFGYSGATSGEEFRKLISVRADAMIETIAELSLKAVVLRLAQAGDREAWLESVTASIVGRPPRTFADRHEREFSVNVHQVARQFKHYETLAHVVRAAQGTSDRVVVRVGLTTSEEDVESVVSVPTERLEAARKLSMAIAQELEESSETLLLVASELIRRAMDAKIPDMGEGTNG